MNSPQTPRTKAYAIAYLREIDFGPEIAEYLERIDETLAPYGGHFLVHGGALTPAEGTWDGAVVVIEFPSTAAVEEWYDSPAYQAILPLRTEHSQSIAAMVEGVPEGYRAIEKVPEVLALATAS
ncbi:DUF1330 domain-containing protein [Nocardioides humilatus]|uniref:DUF1330 domain-containing protein n=1 Tax=Nocardioides humilatus TaxID=2607660 RepID=A0A5B1LFS2_9ACTN|nr:DUF1330 domain-containing protein [Nocardioides humilatus]KAA1419601.1 DUF1330 domain-containing protein [Nocardioides humilatus]